MKVSGAIVKPVRRSKIVQTIESLESSLIRRSANITTVRVSAKPVQTNINKPMTSDPNTRWSPPLADSERI